MISVIYMHLNRLNGYKKKNKIIISNYFKWPIWSVAKCKKCRKSIFKISILKIYKQNHKSSVTFMYSDFLSKTNSFIVSKTYSNI